MAGGNRVAGALMLVALLAAVAAQASTGMEVRAGDPSLQRWLLPDEPPHPADNEPTAERIELGKMLFFDPRLSRHGNMSCATCHNPMFGWSDGLPTARGHEGMLLKRASPTVINTAYNSIQMWDGRKKDLEDQAIGPMEAPVEMNTDFDHLFAFLNSNEGYKAAFAAAYPGKPIDKETIAKAIASYERTVISNDSPFDRWVRGDESAMTEQQVRGFRIFVDPEKGNCEICHSAPNFTDNGFHNIGLASVDGGKGDPGRFAHKPIRILKGAFKTPTLRDITLTAPYFHDGSAKTLMDVVEHYVKGGEVKENLSPNIRPLKLTQQEKEDLVAFMEALTSEHEPVTLPVLPLK